MAADERLTAVVTFVEEYLAADAALAVAAVSEPDDDRYLAAERRAAAFLAKPLTPAESRWAVPGGSSPHASVGVGDSIGPAPLYAVLRVGAQDWIAYTGAKRDRTGELLNDAVRVGVVAGELKVVGRAQCDPFSPGVVWEAAGGLDVPLDAAALEVTALREPATPEHAQWLAERTAASRQVDDGGR